MTKTVFTRKLLFVLLIAVVVRLGVLLAFPGVFAFDQTGAIHGSDAYDAYAQNLLDTGVYGRTPGVPDASIPPLYSYALAGVYGLLGRGYMQVGLFHILLDVLSITMLYHLSKRLLPSTESNGDVGAHGGAPNTGRLSTFWASFRTLQPDGATVGLLAGLCYALYPYLIFQNLTLIDTPFFMTLLYAFLLCMVLLRERERLDRGAWLLAGLGGLVLGFSMLVRPITPPLALAVALWFLFRRGLVTSILRLLPVALVSAAVLLPWIIRNYDVFGAFVPMTTTSGANFWQGNSEYTVRYFRAGYDVQWTAPELTTEDPYSREADAERFALAFQFLRENPDKIPELLWVKFLVYWSIDITPRLNPVDGQLPRLDYQGKPLEEAGADGELALGGLPPGDPVGAYSSTLFDQIGRTVHRFYWGGLFLIGFVGLVLTARYWREVSLLWLTQISMTLVYIAFHPSTRYRVPTDPVWFVFSAYALLWLWHYMMQRRAVKAG
ncbi:MAG: glycosyltransferase family 39 protein [Anaerolineaceae bacterium]|nr:glycosyltransferase family 39 protein [Anaerolineaceae bacterium]